MVAGGDLQFIAFLILISFLIFAHEFGHFIFAKIFGVKVLKFSIGMGPELIKFQGKETRYVIAIIPIGGYVSMLGHDPSLEAEPEDYGRSLSDQANWKRFLIMFAGPAFNLLLPFLLYFVYAVFSTQHLAAQIGQVDPNSPAAKVGIKSGAEILSINGEKTRYWYELARIITAHPGETIPITYRQDGKEYQKEITPNKDKNTERIKLTPFHGKIGITPYYDGPQIFMLNDRDSKIKNFDLIRSINGKKIETMSELKNYHGKGVVDIEVLRSERLKMNVFDIFKVNTVKLTGVSLDFRSKLRSPEMGVWWVHPGSVAEKAGFKQGDYIQSVDGITYPNWVFLQSYLIKQQDKKELSFLVIRGGQKLTLKVKQKLVASENDIRFTPYYELGVVPYFIKEGSKIIPIITSKDVVGDALTETWYNTLQMTEMVFTAVVQLFSGELSLKHLGGPIMMYEASGIALQYGWLSMLKLMAIISINLGLLNLLPIPVLDGGHILFIIAESIRRKPVNQKFKEVTSFIGLMILILLMIFVFKNDIENFILK